ncbi:MAG: NUDIX hydrolase [Gemmatimonadaceae bacterium]
MSLDIDTVRFPNGTTGQLEMIRHSGASAVLPFLTDPSTADPDVLLIRQYRYAAERVIYEVPAGRLDPGESPASCARRELLEETGCHASRLEPMVPIFTTPGFTDEQIHLFMAWDLTRGAPHHEPDEFIELVPMPLGDALRLVEQGRIVDAKTIICLLFAASFRRHT